MSYFYLSSAPLNIVSLELGNNGRSRVLRKVLSKGPVIYWMSRDQRTVDNWALSTAFDISRELGTDLMVAFCLSPEFLGANKGHYEFMLAGLKELSSDLTERNIRFTLLVGDPVKNMTKLVEEERASWVICDHDPLRIKRAWREGILSSGECGAIEVDAHNIVPCWAASPKKEYSAATFRPKIGRMLPVFLPYLPHDVRAKGPILENEFSDQLLDRARKNDTRAQKLSIRAGQSAALVRLKEFISSGLRSYSSDKNDPLVDGQSGLSPYLHFGMVSAQRVALETMMSAAPETSKRAFLEELIVRRELSDNFCHYDLDYDSYGSLPDWARRSLEEHMGDRREYLYPIGELEGGRTHDPLWNAAQMQMVRTGRMHGYMRMYWGKKILEWSETAEEALSKAIVLNDRYELDGRDPNGYAGIGWCIGGLHDRPWPSHPIYGNVRYMSYSGARKKFDVEGYIERYGK